MSGYKVSTLNSGIKMVLGLFEFFLSERNTILGRCPGTTARAPSVNTEALWVESVTEIENLVSLESERCTSVNKVAMLRPQ